MSNSQVKHTKYISKIESKSHVNRDWVLPEPRSRAMPGEGVMLECTDVVLSDAAYAVYAGAENKRDLGVPLPGKVGIQAHEEEGSVQQLSGKATTEARQPIVDRRKDEEKNKERK